jgi:hypothetical protein
MSVATVVSTESDENETLEMLRINVRHWRKESGLSFRYMPVSLWSEAIVAARKFGVGRVACVAGLNLEDLKKRVGRCEAEPEPPAPRELEFIEVPGVVPSPDPLPAPSPSATTVAAGEAPAQRAADEAWLEVLAPDGTKLTLRLPAASLGMAAALVREFRSHA